MDKLFLKPSLVALLFLCAVQFTFAQKTFKVQDKLELVVSGTSSLHDWDMPSDEGSGTMKAKEDSGKLISIESIEVEMPAESIKSGKRAMDKKAYNALKTDKHKTVKYTLKSASKSGDTWTLNGTFQIAGKTKNVKFKAKEEAVSGGYKLSGSYELKLSDFDITPPKALMGTIKTGDDVKITFDVIFK